MLTVAYYRRSSTMQEHSIDLQRYRAFEVAKNHNLIVQKEFLDDAISARKTNLEEREELQNLLNLVKNSKVKNLLVYKRDRLARNVVQHLKMYRILREYKVNVIFTADDELPMNFSSNGELYEIFIGCMVQLEGKQIHERLKAKREANFRSGKNPGNLPFGYSRNSENQIIDRNEVQLALVKEMYDLIITGYPLEEVSKQIKSKSDDRKWSPNYIRNLLQNPTYMGIRIQQFENSPPIVQEYKALKIVDQKTWETVNEIIEQSKHKRKKRTVLDLDYILNGLVYCNKCNKTPYIGSQSKPVYRCSMCKSEIPKDNLEKTVLDHVLVYIKSLLQNKFQLLIENYRKKSLKALQKRLTSAKKELETIKEVLFIQVANEIENEKDQFEPIIETYSQYKEQNNKIEKITSELFSLDQLPSKIEAIKKHMLQTNTTQELLNLDSTEIITDIIECITIEDMYIDLTYKYPFGGLKEAHTLGIK